MTYVPCLDSRLAEKAAMSELIAQQTAEWVAKNGPIPVIDSSVFADPTLPACATMRYRSFAAEKSKEAGLNRMHQSQHRRRSKKNNSDIFGGEG